MLFSSPQAGKACGEMKKTLGFEEDIGLVDH